MTSVDEVLAQMAAGVSIDELARRAAPEISEMVDRCAWVPSFDKEVFAILRRDTPEVADVTFEEVIAHPDVRPVPGRDEAFRVRTRPREQAFRRLAPDHKVPKDLARLSTALAKHFAARDEDLAQLEMLIVSDPAAARAKLVELYDDADRRFDSARCQALLDVVQIRGDVADWRLVREQNELERYLSARLYWRAAYRRTARFLLPEMSDDAFKTLLARGPPNTLQLFGPGGAGKTMHLNALVARMAVPKPSRLACALIDLDLVQLGNAVRRPWLMLVEIAHQLNQQLYRPLFDGFLQQHGKLRAHLLRPHLLGDSIPGQLALDPGDEERFAEDVRREFFETVESTEIGSEVLLIFDTLERITHVDAAHTSGDPRGLLDQLNALRTQLPEGRIVLSGRYDLRQELADLDARFGEVRHLELFRLTQHEARLYLRDRRKLPVADDVMGAAIDSASAGTEGALPFKLALLADALAQRPDMTADEIRELREPELIYVIKRVVDHIDDFRLRWLLLFGVIPRLLSRQFVIEVMAPYLEEAIREPSADVGQALARAGADASFVKDPQATVDPEDLWKKLTRYAASYSWVEMVSPDVLRFHPDVVQPLRHLVSQEPVFAKINADAVEYFQLHAEATPDDRPRMVREALFHRAAIEGADVLRDWRGEVRRPGLDPAVAAALADEIIELGADPESPIDADAVAEARVERAVATLRLATAPGAPRDGVAWDRAREDVEAAERIQAPLGPRLIAARAALLINDGDPAAAMALLKPVRSTPEREDRLIIRVRYADALAQQASPDADKHYRSALRDARKLGVREEDLATLAWKRATALDRCDDLAAAIETSDEALKSAPARGAAHAALSLLRGQVCLRCGEPSAVRDWTTAPLEHGGRLAHEARMLSISAELAAWRTETALSIADDALRHAADGSDSAEAGIRLGQARELRGIVRSQLLDFDGAIADLEAAGLLWDSISSDGARRCHLRIAEIQLRDLQDLGHAMLALIRADNVPGERVGEDVASVHLRRAEWLARSNSNEEATSAIDAALAALAEQHVPPGARARAALAGLALGLPEQPRHWLEELDARLAEIKPAAARLAMLDDLERCPVFDGHHEAGDLRQLRRLVAGASVKADAERLAPPDFHVRLVRLADVARVTGRAREARHLLAEADRVLPPESAGAHARRRFVAAAQRVGADDLVAKRLRFEAAEFKAAIGELARESPGGRRIRAFMHSVRELFDRSDGLTSRWVAHIREAMSRLVAHGDHPTLPAEPPLQSDRLELYSPRPVQAGTSAGIDVFFELRGDALHIHGEGQGERFEHEATGSPLVEVLEGASRRRGGPDRRLAFVLVDPRAAGWELGARILGPTVIAHLEGDVRIWTDGGVLDQVPWELARDPQSGKLLSLERGVRHLVRGQSAARVPGPRSGNEPAHVLLVKPLERDRRSYRGMIKTTLIPPEHCYLRAGMRVELVETVGLAALERAVEATAPHILHIVGSFVDASGGAAIDISSGTAGTLDFEDLNQERLTTTGLALALSRGTEAGPLLILDPPALSRATGLASQLLLRNAFAAELSRIAPIPAIVATGLVRYGAQDALYGQLMHGLAAGHTVAHVVNQIRDLAETDDSEDGYGLAATALFTAEPEYAVR